jgi:hypothetical protein
MMNTNTIETVNTQLVDTLVQVIQALPHAERNLLEQKLYSVQDYPTVSELAHLTEHDPTFEFLNHEPDLYSLEDGVPIS